MKIIKRTSTEIQKEEAHGGSGSRKVYVSSDHLVNTHLDIITHGFLPVGNSYDWHEHENIEEVMVVLKSGGMVYDEDGEYPFEVGDVFVFPPNIKHKITNTSNEECEMIFVRVKS